MKSKKILSHLDSEGKARMVDVTGKPGTVREAKARAFVSMKIQTIQMILERNVPKGDVLCVARVAGIMAAKRTSELIPMCHPLTLTSIEVEFVIDKEKGGIGITAKARTLGPTGVELEALTAASVAALTVYDMCKSADRGMTISDIMLVEKSGGRSGVYRR